MNDLKKYKIMRSQIFGVKEVLKMYGKPNNRKIEFIIKKAIQNKISKKMRKIEKRKKEFNSEK